MKLNRRTLLAQLGTGIAASPFLASVNARVQQNEPAPARKETAGQGRPIHLDRNENGYGPSKKAVAAIQETADQISRYPDSARLQSALANHHSRQRSGAGNAVKPEQIVLGCGSTEVLRMAVSAFLGPGTTLIEAAPTCELMAGFARNAGATVTDVPLRKDHAHDLGAMLEHSNRKGAAGLIYVCNPNSPTGTLTTRKDLEEFLPKVPSTFHVVIDEAYHEYAGGSGAYVSFVEHPAENPRVIVTRTFSTAYGLAGARVGYAVASTAAAERMTKQGLPFASNRSGIFAAQAALADQEYIENCIKRNFDDRQEFMNQVNARMLRALDSHANFVCLNVMRPAGEIFQHYQKNNIVVAPPIASMPTYLRVSLGSPQEMMEFWRVWDLLGSHPMSM
jgi:histidinol-phosphate aminotransferase